MRVYFSRLFHQSKVTEADGSNGRCWGASGIKDWYLPITFVLADYPTCFSWLLELGIVSYSLLSIETSLKVFSKTSVSYLGYLFLVTVLLVEIIWKTMFPLFNICTAQKYHNLRVLNKLCILTLKILISLQSMYLRIHLKLSILSFAHWPQDFGQDTCFLYAPIHYAT